MMITFDGLFARMDASHMSQKELAAKAGLHRTTLTRMRRLSGFCIPQKGKRTVLPAFASLLQVCLVLHCQLSDIVRIIPDKGDPLC